MAEARLFGKKQHALPSPPTPMPCTNEGALLSEFTLVPHRNEACLLWGKSFTREVWGVRGTETLKGESKSAVSMHLL